MSSTAQNRRCICIHMIIAHATDSFIATLQEEDKVEEEQRERKGKEKDQV